MCVLWLHLDTICNTFANFIFTGAHCKCVRCWGLTYSDVSYFFGFFPRNLGFFGSRTKRKSFPDGGQVFRFCQKRSAARLICSHSSRVGTTHIAGLSEASSGFSSSFAIVFFLQINLSDFLQIDVSLTHLRHNLSRGLDADVFLLDLQFGFLGRFPETPL